jgi:hypothetical protein
VTRVSSLTGQEYPSAARPAIGWKGEDRPLQQHDTSASRTLVTHRTLEIIAALLAFAFGASIALGALEYNIGWGEHGPEPGYFPFWMGVVVVVGATGALLEALFSRRLPGLPAAINADQARRIAAFLLPMLGFLVVTVALKLGLYVGTVIYLLTVMLWQGRYRLPAAVAVSFGTAVVFFLMFERWLQVPLMTGPLEAWLGLY